LPLKRKPLCRALEISKMTLGPDLYHKDFMLGRRLCMALLVAVVTYIAWAAVWLNPSFGEAIAGAFARGYHPSTLVVFGNVWQWVFAGTALVTIIAIVVRWRRLLIATVMWLAAFLVLATLSTIAFRWGWSMLFIAIIVTIAIAGIQWFATRTA
jgi:hypothetical protein